MSQSGMRCSGVALCEVILDRMGDIRAVTTCFGVHQGILSMLCRILSFVRYSRLRSRMQQELGIAWQCFCQSGSSKKRILLPWSIQSKFVHRSDEGGSGHLRAKLPCTARRPHAQPDCGGPRGISGGGDYYNITHGCDEQRT